MNLAKRKKLVAIKKKAILGEMIKLKNGVWKKQPQKRLGFYE
jgi:hypothetical protein